MLNVLKLDTPEGLSSYKAQLSSIPISEPYHLPDYIDIFSGGVKNLICFAFQTDATLYPILMPGFLNPISIDGEKSDFFDFITPYGYTGPIFYPNIESALIDEFWKEVDIWYNENNVVTEFIRFNLFGNQLSYSGFTVPTMLNIKGHIINQSIQWTSFDAKVRKNVNRAIRENLTSTVYYKEIDENVVSEFYEIYIQTMKRTEAKANFFYEQNQFKLFVQNNKDNVAICTVYFENKAVSSELLLVSDDSIYSFLGGTNENFFEKRPNDFLKVEALNWAREQGKKYYILGGGYGFEDGIFKYKKSFFPNDVVSYYTGRKIINQEVYRKLVDKVSKLRQLRGMEKLDLSDTSFFPLYNKNE